MKRWLSISLFLLAATLGFAANIPPAPTQHFTDYAGVVSKEVVATLDANLANLEKTDSTQFYVVIYPKFDGSTSLEDFTQKTAQAWKIGQKGKDNGLILFLFADDGTGHKLIRYEIGYGLEGRFTDASSKILMERAIVPNLKAGNWNAAVNAGVNGTIAQIKGEYTVTKEKTSWGWKIWACVFIMGVWLVFLCIAPHSTLSITGDILNLIIIIASGGKSGSSGSSGGGGSFGGGGSSGKT